MNRAELSAFLKATAFLDNNEEAAADWFSTQMKDKPEALQPVFDLLLLEPGKFAAILPSLPESYIRRIQQLAKAAMVRASLTAVRKLEETQ